MILRKNNSTPTSKLTSTSVYLRWIVYGVFCYCLGFFAGSNIWSTFEVEVDTQQQKLFMEDAQKVGDLKNLMPIVRSTSKGFNPVYVYSQARKTRKPPVKSRYSQVKQDVLVIALMDANEKKIAQEGNDPNSFQMNKRYFLDLAANDPFKFSNSYLLEQKGWNGLCIEPNPLYWYDLAAYRSCTVIGAFIGGTQEEDGTEVDVIFINQFYGGIVATGFDNSRNRAETKRNTVSILTVLQETNAPNIIDFFSLDVEGAESMVMKEFPWDLYKFRFICIERPKEDLRYLLEENGYIEVLQLAQWGETFWINEAYVMLSLDEIKEIWGEV